MRDIGKNIKDIRTQNNLTQDELAEKLFVTRQTVSNYETGRTRPDIDSLVKISEVLHTDIHTLIYGSEETNNRSKMKLVLYAALGITAALFLIYIKTSKIALELKAKEYIVAPTYWNYAVFRPILAFFVAWTVMQALGTFFKLSRLPQKHKKTAAAVICVLALLYAVLFVPNLLYISGVSAHLPKAWYSIMYIFLGINPAGIKIPFHIVLGAVIGAGIWLCDFPKIKK